MEQGRVYCALSPLYHINLRKKNWAYFIDKNDFLAYVQDQFMKNYEVLNSKGKKYTKSQLHSIIMRNHPYKDLLKSIADTYAIYPVLLEDILVYRKLDFKKFKKAIESKYRFVKVEQKNGIRIIDGLVNEVSHEVIMSNVIMNACIPLLPYIDNSDNLYYVNKRKCGLYELLSIFQESEPKNIDRAKGLGSLNALEIGVSTLDPNNRTLLRYTCEDINKEIEEMRRVNDNKFSLIKDIDISQYEF